MTNLSGSDGLNLTICIFYWMSSLTLASLLDLAVKPILGIGVSGFYEPVLCVLFSNAYPIMMTSVSLSLGFVSTDTRPSFKYFEPGLLVC
jgi:hypothetical protein